jgi:hypothetical protein
MLLAQSSWSGPNGWADAGLQDLPGAQLVLVFASPDVICDTTVVGEIQARYPQALLFGCSTAGEILDCQVLEETAVVTAIELASTRIEHASLQLTGECTSFEAGRVLAAKLPLEGLVHVLALSEGVRINGSDLVRGLTDELPAGVTVTGGLSGDGDRFSATYVLVDGVAKRDAVAVVGLYGESLRVGYGSLGGWDPFGPERLITRAEGNVLYELDGQSALELYKTYLGEHAAGLPATGLLFPLSLRGDGETRVVRTILAVDEDEQSMTFAGDLPVGSYAQLMKANFDRLIDGAVGAAQTSSDALGSGAAELALLISCVGRKLVLKQRVEEELEGVREVLGPQPTMTGFYSYGEISPFAPSAACELHNQTMTITTFAEV